MAWEGKEATLATIVYRVQYRGDRGGGGAGSGYQMPLFLPPFLGTKLFSMVGEGEGEVGRQLWLFHSGREGGREGREPPTPTINHHNSLRLSPSPSFPFSFSLEIGGKEKTLLVSAPPPL